MRTFIKLLNGTIVLMTKKNEVHKVGHGINLKSPKLKTINFPLENIDKSWNVDAELIEDQLGKSRVTTAVPSLTNDELRLIEKRTRLIGTELEPLHSHDFVPYKS